MSQRQSKPATPRPISAQPLTQEEFQTCSQWLESVAENLGFLVHSAEVNNPRHALQVYRDCVTAANYLWSHPNWFAPRVWRVLEQCAEPSDVISACGETAPNAHNMAFRLAPKMMGAISAVDPKADDRVAAMKPQDAIFMTDDTWPKRSWPAVRKAIRGFPMFDAKALALRIKAERQRCLTRWAVPTKEKGQDGPWSQSDTPSRWAKRFKISSRTFVRYVRDGKIRARKLSNKSYQVHLACLPAGQK